MATETVPLKTNRKRSPHGAPARFIRDVVLTYEGNDCLIWPFARHRDGRPQFILAKKQMNVCRIICEARYGHPPTAQHEAAHSCGAGDTGCVTPKHLRWATPDENRADRILHGNWGTKLTETDVRKIFSMKGSMTLTKIAERFGVHLSTVSVIHSRKEWTWLDLPDQPTARAPAVNDKLTPVAVREIRQRLADGESQRAIARDYGVTHTAIYKISAGKRWSHVT